MFMGEYNHTRDDKGRITIPSKLRDDLGAHFVVTRGIDLCLAIYPIESWNKIITGYQVLPNTSETRNIMRFLTSGATMLELDKQGRINLSDTLASYAHLEKECTIVGINDHVEIWNTNKWQEYIAKVEPQAANIMDMIFSKNL